VSRQALFKKKTPPPGARTWQIGRRDSAHVYLARFLRQFANSPILVLLVVVVIIIFVITSLPLSSPFHRRATLDTAFPCSISSGLLRCHSLLPSLLAMLQPVVMTLERLVTEPCSDLANRLVRLRIVVKARQVERAVHARALARAKVGPDDD
jgi:hypothetical protein